jgi:Bacteriophage HK97-gp10, putative tail-component
MASATFRVTNPAAPRLAVAPGVRTLADHLADQAAQRSPRRTGRMAASWEVVAGDDPATSVVINTAPYARYVEYGTRFDPAQAPLGRAIAAGPR